MHALPDLAALQRFDSPTICNAIELFEVRPRTAGYMNREIAACFPELPPMVGYAVTTTFCSSQPAGADIDPGVSSRLISSFADLPGPAVVVFQDLDDPPAGATFGDGMCLTYKTFGAVGLITSGAARDIDNVRALHFPCFSNGVMSGHGYCHFEETVIPVEVGGLTIRPGDLLHGDCNGVVTIPAEIAAAVPYACEQYLKYEALVLDPLRAGRADLAEHQQNIQEMQARLAELKIELKSMIES
ncbi:4-hydroxy-4-methyl-2-oxoglutarate aldolase [Gimesia panareensis]|uniref:Putative 4-hydroxy-4-methyl-2-oxoglutarate aldolase n=1 Tax=Gimesia panareensis TaxID=2527978 RepID=A0A518FLI5_9PLAN|nr:RraA family protein [Gimesia panareensis]QDV17218.1 4-hydroxy-4-methyl-2-oxoglutarate aldolase [Gimesia panareensis]